MNIFIVGTKIGTKRMADIAKIKHYFSRVKWGPVFALIIIVAIILLVIFGSSIKLFQPSYKTSRDIEMRVWGDPGKLDIKGKATAMVEIKNRGNDPVDVRLELLTYDSTLSFIDTGSQKVNRTLSLGPKESRVIDDFRIDFQATDAGRYGVKVAAYSDGDEITDEIFFELVED